VIALLGDAETLPTDSGEFGGGEFHAATLESEVLKGIGSRKTVGFRPAAPSLQALTATTHPLLVPFGSKIPSGLAVVSLKLQQHSSSKITYSGPVLTRGKPSQDVIWLETRRSLRGCIKRLAGLCSHCTSTSSGLRRLHASMSYPCDQMGSSSPQ